MKIISFYLGVLILVSSLGFGLRSPFQWEVALLFLPSCVRGLKRFINLFHQKIVGLLWVVASLAKGLGALHGQGLVVSS